MEKKKKDEGFVSVLGRVRRREIRTYEFRYLGRGGKKKGTIKMTDMFVFWGGGEEGGGTPPQKTNKIIIKIYI